MSKFLQLKKERVAKGLCPNCGRKAEPRCYRCNDCGLRHRVTERKRYGCSSFKEVGINEHLVKYQGEE